MHEFNAIRDVFADEVTEFDTFDCQVTGGLGRNIS
jgi:hypothetical protein